MMQALIQVAIALMGGLAAWLSFSPTPTHKVRAAWIGLCAQPFWLYSTFEAQQWGMFAVALVYTAAFVRGLRQS